MDEKRGKENLGFNIQDEEKHFEKVAGKNRLELKATDDCNNQTETGLADVDQPVVAQEKRAIMKNVILISFAFMLLFTSYQSMASLQSSINKVTLIKMKGFINSNLRSIFSPKGC